MLKPNTQHKASRVRTNFTNRITSGSFAFTNALLNSDDNFDDTKTDLGDEGRPDEMVD